DCVRRRRRLGCRAPVSHPDARKHLLRPARRDRGYGNHFASRAGGATPVKRSRYFALLALLAMSSLMLIACSTSPGQPKQGSETPAPSEIADFSTLYAQNCAGCHGAEGRGGASIVL